MRLHRTLETDDTFCALQWEHTNVYSLKLDYWETYIAEDEAIIVCTFFDNFNTFEDVSDFINYTKDYLNPHI